MDGSRSFAARSAPAKPQRASLVGSVWLVIAAAILALGLALGLSQ
jgi:hypothetical protein